MHASEAAIVLCSVTSRHSFESASIFVDQFKRIKGVFNSDSFTICIVGNKTDCLSEREISSAEGYSLGRMLECTFSECSALRNKDNEVE